MSDAGAEIPPGEGIEPRKCLVEQEDAAPAEHSLRQRQAMKIDATECGSAGVGRGGEAGDVERVMYERPPCDAGRVETGVVRQHFAHRKRRREDRRLWGKPRVAPPTHRPAVGSPKAGRHLE